MGSGFSSSLQSFFRWWSDELKWFLPDTQISRKSRKGRRLLLSVESDRRRVIRENGGATATLTEMLNAGGNGISELARVAAEHPKFSVGLRFTERDCYIRTLELPARAEHNYGRILDLDMERTMPFRSGEVLTAYYVMPGSGTTRDKRLVRHLIVKRKTIEPLLIEMRERGLRPAFADCWDEARWGGLPVNFLAAPEQGKKPRSTGFVRIMGTMALVLALSAVTIAIVRHQNALAGLETQVADARNEAAAVRLAVETSQNAATRITAMEQLVEKRLPVAGILEELTKLLPDTAWVSDLRIDGEMVEFTGFARSAASLVPVLEQSPLFSDVNLTSPVVFDNEENAERFSLRLRLMTDRTAESDAGDMVATPGTPL